MQPDKVIIIFAHPSMQVPSAVLNMSWDPTSAPPNPPFLKSDLVARVQDL